MNDKKLTYEESVQLLRNDPQQAAVVEFSYLDEDNFAAAQRFAASEEFAAIVKVLKLDQGDRTRSILDLGCGNGIVSYAFASLGHNVYAVDPDTSLDVGLGAAARLASKVSSGQISTVQAFAESLPFSDNTFDVIYTRQALHHFGDLDQGLTECARVLKPRGFLLATREHVVDDEAQLSSFLDNHIMHQLHGGENAYPLTKYIHALKQAGLRVVKDFAPYDTVINHFPTSNAELKDQLKRSLSSRVGSVAASLISSIPGIEPLYRMRLSQACAYPGRLYSFLYTKG